MVFRIAIFLVSLVLAVLPSYAQYREGSAYDELYDSETTASMKRHVRELSAASMEGRKAGTEGETAAAAYVESVFNEYGVDMISPSGGDIFGIRSEKGDTLTSRNVVGFVQGYDRNLKNNYIVVGARLDNLGTITMNVDGSPVERIYAGANGNASGLAMLVELARMVQTNSILFRRSVLFVAFGASYESFAGSWYFLNRSFPEPDKIDAMVNLDMLGTGYNGFYAFTGSNTDMNTILRTLTGDLQPVLPEVITMEPYPSDHRSFYASEIPSVFFTTGRYPEHDTDRDTQSIIDYSNMERELEYIFNCTVALANAQNPPAFRQGQAVAGKSSDEEVVSFYECDYRPMFFGSADPKSFISTWVYKYLKYPESAVREGIQGTVQVEMIIGKDGKVVDVKVIRGVSEELDAEALKVVSASPKWTPGRVNGNKVKVSLTIPVEFRLERKGKK